MTALCLPAFAGPQKGMQLGKKKKSANFLQAIAHEDGLDASVVEAAGNHGDAQARGLHKQGSAAAQPRL